MGFRKEQDFNDSDEERIIQWLHAKGVEHVDHVTVVCIYSQSRAGLEG